MNEYNKNVQITKYINSNNLEFIFLQQSFKKVESYFVMLISA